MQIWKFPHLFHLLRLITIIIIVGNRQTQPMDREKAEMLTFSELEEKISNGLVHKILVIEHGSGLLDKVIGVYQLFDAATRATNTVSFECRAKIGDEEKTFFSKHNVVAEYTMGNQSSLSNFYSQMNPVTLLILCLIILFVASVFWFWMLIDCLKNEDPQEKIVWFFVILLLSVLGSILYFLIRKQSRGFKSRVRIR